MTTYAGSHALPVCLISHEGALSINANLAVFANICHHSGAWTPLGVLYGGPHGSLDALLHPHYRANRRSYWFKIIWPPNGHKVWPNWSCRLPRLRHAASTGVLGCVPDHHRYAETNLKK